MRILCNMVKARIIIAGNLERTGYRIYVKQIARNLGIKGIISILDNGLAQIWCEGEKSQLAQFRKMIEVISDEDEPFSMHTHAINVFVEGSPGYTGRISMDRTGCAAPEREMPEEGVLKEKQQKRKEDSNDEKPASDNGENKNKEIKKFCPPDTFGQFSIDYGEQYTPFEQEMMEMQELQILFLSTMSSEIKSINAKIEKLEQEQYAKPKIRPRGGNVPIK
ncbi:MAG: acylphosphatase [Thermoplasmata archaeon]